MNEPQLPHKLSDLLTRYEQVNREIADGQRQTERLLVETIYAIRLENDRLRAENERMRAFVTPVN